MKIFTESNFARASALVSVLVLGALGPQTLYSSSPGVELTRHLLIQGSNVERLVDLVESVGGTISEELSVLKAVAVEVTPSQLEQISRSADVHRILDDRKVAVVDTDGDYWNQRTEDGQEVAVVDTDGDYWNQRTEDGQEVAVVDTDGDYWNNV